MPNTTSAPGVIRFDKYEVDVPAGRLFKRGIRVKLREQSLKILAILLEHAGEVVTREELRKQLWLQDIFVDFDNILNTAVARLRQALNDSAENPRFIETLPKHGYRFVGSLSKSNSESAQMPAWRAKIVVLPFANLSADPRQKYVGDAVTDEVITELAALAPDSLGVIARTTAMCYKGTRKDVARIGRDLAVDYVVEGSIHRSGDQIGLHVQLIRVSDQMHLFSRKYDAELHDVFITASRTARDIASHIGITQAPDESRGAAIVGKDRRKSTEDLAAYSDYIQARHFLAEFSAEGLAKAKKLLESALARDLEFALAYDALAEVYWLLGYLGFMPPREAFSSGIMNALRAIEIDNTQAETHALLGQFHKAVEYNWLEVHREMALALRLNPTSPLVRFRYAWGWLMPQGRLEEAVAVVESALQLDPLSLIGRTWLAVLLVLWHQHERTLEAARQALEVNPNAYWAYISMGSTYRDQGELEKAILAYRRALEVSGGPASIIGWLGLTLGLSGNTAEARALLKRLHAKAAQGYVPPTSYAWIHLGLGEIDSAFKWLNRAVDECDQYMMPIKSYRFFDPIRADPRFQTLLRKMNLDVPPAGGPNLMGTKRRASFLHSRKSPECSSIT
jgi:TolB-like protein/tetratricopeptide (TPR) repeat protein